MTNLELLILKLLTKNGTMSPYGKYRPYFDKLGKVQTVASIGVGDNTGEYIIPSVKNGKPLTDPYSEMIHSGEYFARYPNGLLGRALGNYSGKLIHKWQEENNMPVPR